MDSQMLNGVAPKAWTQGTLASRVSGLHKALNLYGRQQVLDRDEVLRLLELAELHACLGEWDRVVEITSQGIVLGCGPNSELRLYRAWIEGLKEEHDTTALHDLGRHLLGRRTESSAYAALALLSLTYAGQVWTSRAVFGQLFRLESTNSLVQECLAIYQCESLDAGERSRGIETLLRLSAKPVCGYFSDRATLNYALECEMSGAALNQMKRMSQRYVAAPDPYMNSALIAISEGQWQEAGDFLKPLLTMQPGHTDAVLLTARCMEMQDELSAARALLIQKADHFGSDDYEFEIGLGMVEARMFAETSDKELKLSAIEHLERALTLAPLYGMPDQPIATMIEGMGQSTRSARLDSSVSERYWMLSIDSAMLESMLGKGSFMVRCPVGMDKNDVVFFSARQRSRVPGKAAVSGMFHVVSAPAYDAKFGRSICLGRTVAFDHDASIVLDSRAQSATDLFGEENFSATGRAFFYSLETSLVKEIVSQVESKGFQLKRAV